MSSEPQPADVPRFLSALQALGRGELDLASTLGVDSGILERVADRAVGLMQHGKLDQAEALEVVTDAIRTQFEKQAHNAHKDALSACYLRDAK